MTDNQKHAERLREMADNTMLGSCGTPTQSQINDQAALLAGAEALERKGTCAHCDERDGGFEGTIWCQECLYWWQDKHKDDTIAKLQEALEAQGRWHLTTHAGKHYMIPVDDWGKWCVWKSDAEAGEPSSIVPEYAREVQRDVVFTGWVRP